MSLLLCAATAAAWVRSYWIADGFARIGGGTLTTGRLARGRLAIAVDRGVAKPGAMPLAHVRWAYPVDGFDHPYLPGRPPDIDAFFVPEWTLDVPTVSHQFLGFAARSGHYGFLLDGPKQMGPTPHQTAYYRVVAVPAWPLCAVTAWPVGWWAVLAARAMRRRGVARRLDRVGRCAGCGYDLRASGRRCPECGRITTMPRP